MSIFFDGTDAVDNIVGALRFASTEKIKEVCVYFGGKLLLGNRATKISNAAFDAFISPNYPELNKNDTVGNTVSLSFFFIFFYIITKLINLAESVRDTKKPDLAVHTTINPNVTLIHLYPNIKSEMVRANNFNKSM